MGERFLERAIHSESEKDHLRKPRDRECVANDHSNVDTNVVGIGYQHGVASYSDDATGDRKQRDRDSGFVGCPPGAYKEGNRND